MGGDALELEVTMQVESAKQFGIKVLCSPGGEEETSIIYDTEKQVVRVDLTRTSLDKNLMDRYEPFDFNQEAELKLEQGELLEFHIFIDKSVLEVFINNRLCLTHRVYPQREDSKGVVLFSIGGSIKVPVINAWEIFPSNPY